ncbi:regulatory GntR family protein [Flavobacteriaceae bacterium MAR_2009_75]|nr:regulatory GntR family protein [Flavobacteriaceae bacterium MAR_2009_75]
MLNHIKINHTSRKPKYQQIVDSIVENIASDNFKIDERLPSINKLSEEFNLSRDTVEKAYNLLKEQKVIVSFKGKGNFVNRTSLIAKTNILFLINKLSNYKMTVYNSFVAHAGVKAYVDLQIYHCDEGLFLNLLNKNIGSYDYYIVMPHFKTDSLNHISTTPDVEKALSQISKDRLVLLDNKGPSEDLFLQIYQDFEEDIYTALNEGIDKILAYNKLVLVYPEKSVYPYPKRILHGFRKFCVQHHLDYEIYDEIYDEMILKKGDAFIVIEENDLVNLLKIMREKDFVLGKEIGIISYNETPLKELLGITVISTNFIKMGQHAAERILNKKGGNFKNEFNFIDRNSI